MESLASTISLAAVMSALSPLELVKTRIQTNTELVLSGSIPRPYNGFMDCLKTIAKSEGTKALWKGNFIGLARFFPAETVNCYIKNIFRAHLPKNIISNIAAGIGGGWGAAVLFYPIETVRIFISTSTLPTKPTLRHLNQNIKSEGAKYLYRGFSSLLLSIALFRGIFFGYYDTFKDARKEKLWKWITAYFSGLLAGLSVHPVETMRKRAIISKSSL